VPAVLADTHAALWFLYDSARLSGPALAALRAAAQDGSPLYLASISVVEVRYLVEKGRLPAEAAQRLEEALARGTTVLTLVPLDLAVAQALAHIPRDVVPDMPDRIIAATALHLGVPLVTRDAMIQAAPITTIW
jgi:PIN domain nuclease of toxin-antitoxin system